MGSTIVHDVFHLQVLSLIPTGISLSDVTNKRFNTSSTMNDLSMYLPKSSQECYTSTCQFGTLFQLTQASYKLKARVSKFRRTSESFVERPNAQATCDRTHDQSFVTTHHVHDQDCFLRLPKAGTNTKFLTHFLHINVCQDSPPHLICDRTYDGG